MYAQMGNPYRTMRTEMEGRLNALRQPLLALRSQQVNLHAFHTGPQNGVPLLTISCVAPYIAQLSVIKALLKSKDAKASALKWMSEAIACNAGAQAERLDELKVASEGFMLNLTALLLNLSKPFMGDAGRESKISKATAFVTTESQNFGAFPADLTPLVPPVEQSSEGSAAAEEVNFITQCFFLTWRALHLGLVSSLERRTPMLRAFSHRQDQAHRAGADLSADPQLVRFYQEVVISSAALCEPSFIEDALNFFGTAARWLVARQSEGDVLPAMPEHFVSDIATFLIEMARQNLEGLESAAAMGGGRHFEAIFECAIGFLAQPSRVHGPHLRAKLGEVLYAVYLENSAKPDEQGRMPKLPCFSLLRSNPRAQRDLAPALLQLYGDVEHIGLQGKLDIRMKLARLLKYLWESPEHRSTFRRIAADEATFVRFANGLMKETNEYMANIMGKLLGVRNTQQAQLNTVTWNARSEEDREQELSRYRSYESELRGYVPLCNETIHMLAYLTSDPEIQRPFLLPQLLDRLASMLLSVLVQLVGSKGLEIKVNNPEEYEFRPREMLSKICETIAHFSEFEAFQVAVSQTGYYNTHPGVLPKASSTVRKHNLLPADLVGKLESLVELVEKAATANKDEDEIMGDNVPEHYLDPVLYTIMKDPVKLPSGNIMDRSSITQHLLNDPKDPFNRQPLTVDQLVPVDDLRAEIEAWRATKTQSPADGGEAAMTD